MTAGAAIDGVNVACPFLGLMDDSATRFSFPSTVHRCHATRRPSTIDLPKQGRDCLTAEHVTCPRYHPPALRTTAMEAVRVQAVPHVLPAGRTGPRSRRRLTRLVIIVLALVVTVLLGLLLGVGLARLSSSASVTQAVGGGASESPTATVVSTAAPTLDATTSPSRAPRPTPSPPIPSPSRAGQPSPSGPVVHVVQSGENLTLIAEQYGVTVAALKASNDLADPNLIFVGQRLVIPAR